MSAGTPPPSGGRSRRALVAVGSIAALALAFAAGVVVGDRRDDNDDRAVESTPRPSDTEPVEGTRPAGTATGDGDALPEASPPVPFTRVADVIYPADVAALRVTLDQLGFPPWWPLPDAVAPRSAPFATVQHLTAGDSVDEPGTTNAISSSSVTSRWLVDSADVAAAETIFVAKVPADVFDVQRGLEDKTTTNEDGITEITHLFPGLSALHRESLYMSISDAIEPDTGVRVGTFVHISYSRPPQERPPVVPTGSAPGKQFLARAPSLDEMEWHRTDFGLTGQLGSSSVSEAAGTYSAKWKFASGDLDLVVAFLSDPANFTGDLKPITSGRFELDDYWVQPMDYQGLEGRYEISVTDPDEHLEVLLIFVIPAD